MSELCLSRQERNQLFRIADEFKDFNEFKNRFTEWKLGAKWANEDYLLLDEKDENRVTFLCALLRRELDRQGDIEKILDYMKVQIQAIAKEPLKKAGPTSQGLDAIEIHEEGNAFNQRFPNFNVIQPVMPWKEKTNEQMYRNAEKSKISIKTKKRVKDNFNQDCNNQKSERPESPSSDPFSR
ncbi:MAG: hypothetical protein EOM62_10560 [Bacteroidia bacterium]|nr:hypothetical protein [Bacteroidia bacterium]